MADRKSSRQWTALFGAFAALLLAGAGAPGGDSSSAGYDPARDPAADLRQAIAEAQASGRRILLEVGGEWCVWCHYLERFLADHPDLRRRWDDGFVTVKVNYSDENRNEAFLARFPKVEGYPHLFVLDREGALLHSQNTGDLEKGRSYSPKAVREFLARWAPTRPPS